jgi:hypothetical protein
MDSGEYYKEDILTRHAGMGITARDGSIKQIELKMERE